MRSIALVLTAFGAFGVLLVPPASAVTTTVTFDDKANGTAVSALTGATLSTSSGAPTVFTPSHTTTFSPPRALHTPGPCPGTSCNSDNENTITITFDTPKSSVSARVGVDSYPMTEFGMNWRIRAYNGKVLVAQSGDNYCNCIDYTPITRFIKAQSASTNITRATISAGQTGLSGRLDLDNLVYTDDAPPPLPEPTVSISDPAAGTVYDTINAVRVSGHVTAAAGLSRFCLTTATDPTIPADCPSASAIEADGNFSGQLVSGIHSGSNTITAWVEDGQLRRTSTSVTVRIAEPDLRIANMEVVQAVQDVLPNVGPANFELAHSATYNGVPLAAVKSTAVRVWVGARFDSGRSIPGVFVQLRGFRGPDELPGGPLGQLEPARTITSDLAFEPLIPDVRRSDAGTSFTFRLPASWTTAGTISLQAIINPLAGPSQPNECAGCLDNNVLRLDGVQFRAVRPILVTAGVGFSWRNATDGIVYRVTGEPSVPFSAARAVSPFGIRIEGYRALDDISSIGNSSRSNDDKNGDVLGRVSSFESRNNAPGHVVGVNVGVARGLTAPAFFCCDPPRIKTLAVMEALRPLTSVAHELYHQEGFGHAGHNCPGDPGGFLGLGAANWPAGDRGLMLSFGYDLRPLGPAQPMVIFGQGQTNADGAAIENFDFMSYCVTLFANGIPNAGSNATDGNDAWISAINWRQAFANHAARRRARAVATAAQNPGASDHKGPTIEVHTFLVGDDETTTIEPASGDVSKPATDSDAQMVLTDRNGKVVAQTAAVLTNGHVNGGPVVRVASATLPAERAAALSVLVDGKPVAKRTRSRHVPKVRFKAPKRGTQIPSTGTTRVRWTARDADKRSTLTASIDYSANGGKKWRTVALGLRGTRYRLKNGLLAKSANARLRLRVSDGWNEGRAVSKRLRVAGPQVKARILDPGSAGTVAAGATIALAGEATDERGRAVRGAALRWYDGRRLIGRGARLHYRATHAGRRTLRLVARGGDGRRGTATRRVRVLRSAPVLIVRPPRHLSHRSSGLRLRVSSTLPGRLRAAGHTWWVGARDRVIRVPVARGYRPVALRLRLRADGVTRVTPLSVPRR